MVRISTNPMTKKAAKQLRNRLRSNGYKVAMIQVSGMYTREGLKRKSHIVKAER